LDYTGRLRTLSILLLLALFAFNLYRARTQSIVIDEAYTYNLFVDAPVSNLLKIYNANHHVLHSLLCRISVGLFGLSELSMRLPSLLGGLFYMLTILRISRYVFGCGWFSLLSFSLLTMSPGVLDYMSAARGYGLALAFFTWALFHLMLYFVERREDSINKASAGLALATASNLTFIFPGAAVAIAFLIWLYRDKRLGLALDRFLVPGVVIAFVFLVVPIAHAQKDLFYAGTRDLAASVESVISIAWKHHDDQGISLTGALPWLQRWARIVLPGILLAATAMCFRVKGSTPWGALLFLATTSLIGSVALVIAAHRLFGLLYPERRTGLYWIPLSILICLLLFHSLWTGRYRLAAAPFLAMSLLCLAQFISQLCVRHYGEWPIDTANRALAQAIRRHHASWSKAPIRVGVASWSLEAGLNFYRRMYRLDWMLPLDRLPIDDRCDYYVAFPFDAAKLEQFPVRIVYEDPITHAVVAVHR
jgi:hypothetical protein